MLRTHFEPSRLVVGEQLILGRGVQRLGALSPVLGSVEGVSPWNTQIFPPFGFEGKIGIDKSVI